MEEGKSGLISASEAFALLAKEDDLREEAEVLLEDISEAITNLQGLLEEFKMLMAQK